MKGQRKKGRRRKIDKEQARRNWKHIKWVRKGRKTGQWAIRKRKEIKDCKLIKRVCRKSREGGKSS